MHRVDYMDIYALVVNNITVRMLLANVASIDLELDHMDIVTVSLYGYIDEDLFMESPEGLRGPKRLKDSEASSALTWFSNCARSLYGQKQAPRLWYAKIHSFLVDELRFRSS